MSNKINGFRDIAQKYDCFLFDLWGVLYEGGAIFEDALGVLSKLHALRKPVVLVSNSPYSNVQCASFLKSCGLPMEFYKTVLTAGDLCAQYIQSNYTSPQKFYVIDSHYWETWEKINKFHSSVQNITEADAILGLAVPAHLKSSREMEEYYDGIFKQVIDRNLPFLCANPDLWALASEKLQMRPGLIAKWYQQLGGKVISFGKPFSEIFIQALEVLGYPERVLMTGDTEYNDIQGALNHNIDAMLITQPYGNQQILTSKATYFSSTLKW